MSFKSIKRTIRKQLGPRLHRLGHASGLMRLEAWLNNRRGAIAFMYHSVADASSSAWIDPRNHVPRDVFAQQMRFLAEHRTVISLDELVARIQSGEPVDDGTVVLTFDDGYLDNLTVAAPILAEYGLPATVFLPTGYIDRGETQWVDQAYSAFRFRTARRLEWGTEPVQRFDLEQFSERERAYRLICDALLISGAEDRRWLLDTLCERLQPRSLPPRLSMNWDDVRKFLEVWPGFSVGGHTVEHTDITRLTVETALQEIRLGLGRIDEELGVKSVHFSFCYGRSCEPVRRLLPSIGLAAAFGDCSRQPAINAATSDRFNLPRVEPPSIIDGYDLASSPTNGGLWRRLAP